MENHPIEERACNMANGIISEANSLILQATGEKERLSEETDFPLEILPTPIREIALEMWRGLSFPIDYVAVAMLTAVSAGVGSTIRAKFKEGFVSYCNIFAAAVGCPGANKTYPLKEVLKPIIEYDNMLDEKNRERVRNYKEMQAIPVKQRQEMGLPLIIEEPVIEQIIVQDVTQEAIKKTLQQNPRGLCLYMDELDGWLNNFTRYSKDSSDEQFWLSVFSNAWTKTGRKSELLSSVSNDPVVSVLGTIQDDLLSSLCNGKKGKNGFFDRILFAHPINVKVGKLSLVNPDYSIIERWHTMMWKLLNQPVVIDEKGEVVPMFLNYTMEATLSIIEWQNREADDCNTRGKQKPAKGSVVKLMTYVHRFCIILHVMHWMCGECELGTVDKKVATEAILLVQYFARTAVRSIEYIHVGRLTYFEQILYKCLPSHFAAKEAKDIAKSEELIMCEREVERFLSSQLNILFVRPVRGQYIKLYQL